jgi:hypothetical protein
MAKAKTPKTSGSAAKKPRIAAQPAAEPMEATPMREAEPQQIRELPPELHERIRVRAYELWQQRGRRYDTAEQDWLTAEKEILGQHGASRSA